MIGAVNASQAWRPVGSKLRPQAAEFPGTARQSIFPCKEAPRSPDAEQRAASAAWCAADPGPTGTVENVAGSRLCGAALHAAPRPGHEGQAQVGTSTMVFSTGSAPPRTRISRTG